MNSQRLIEKKYLQLEVFSDVICPWCFLGKRRLDKALAAADEKYDIQVHWWPFELNPEMQPQGADRQDYIRGKFGSGERFAGAQNRLIALGAAEGISYAFDRIKRIPNTLNAHRLIWLAQQQGLQDEVIEALFQGYFVDAKDIGDKETLVQIAGQAGLDAETVRKLLDTDKAIAEIRREEDRAHELEIHGVPHFMIKGASLSGAQPVETLLEFFAQAAQTD